MTSIDDASIGQGRPRSLNLAGLLPDQAPGTGPALPHPMLREGTVRHSFRAKRFEHIRMLIQSILDDKGFANILDLGGTESYWSIGRDFIHANRDRLHITLVNPEAGPVVDATLFSSIVGDATEDKLLAGQKFDLVHSNSVIEHVGDWARMQRFAHNIRRLAPSYFVQTPNFWFPYEPHFLVPGFQYLPARIRTELMMRFSLGFFPRMTDWNEARVHVEHHRLLSASEMRRLFPDARLERERLFGLSKSLMMIRDASGM